MAYAETRPLGWHKYHDTRPAPRLLNASKTAHDQTKQHMSDPPARNNMESVLEATLRERLRRELYLNCERSMGVPK